MVTSVKHLMPYWKTLIFVLTPLLLSPMIIAVQTTEARCGYVVILMVIYWMTEALPLAVTSLLPVALFPLFGVMSTESVSITYLKEANMMFFGGLVIAIAVEHCNLHKRIALRVMMICGTTPKWLMFGFMMTSMFMSMWINNTAATAMMLPIIEAVLDELFRNDLSMLEEGKNGIVNPVLEMRTESSPERGTPERDEAKNLLPEGTPVLTAADDQERRLLRKLLLLSLAYSSNIGGTGTLTGTAPNLVLKGVVDQIYGSQTGLNFASWMVFAVPTMLLCCLGAWGVLVILYTWYRPKGGRQDRSQVIRHLINNKYAELGSMSFHESAILTLFVVLVCLWLFREPQFMPGWADMFTKVKIKDATAAISIVILLFVIPAHIDFPGFTNKRYSCSSSRPDYSKTLLEWKVLQEKMPWGILLLLGGGFALAEGSKVSGLSQWVGSQLATFEFMPSQVIVLVVCLMAATLTEVASNTATATILLPILANMSQAVQVHPLYLMFPATVTCSFAFMLPIATPPNAIVFSTGSMETKEMYFPGFLMKLLTLAITMLMINTLGTYVFHLNTYPDWAKVHNITEVTKQMMDFTVPTATAAIGVTATTIFNTTIPAITTEATITSLLNATTLIGV